MMQELEINEADDDDYTNAEERILAIEDNTSRLDQLDIDLRELALAVLPAAPGCYCKF